MALGQIPGPGPLTARPSVQDSIKLLAKANVGYITRHVEEIDRHIWNVLQSDLHPETKAQIIAQAILKKDIALGSRRQGILSTSTQTSVPVVAASVAKKAVDDAFPPPPKSWFPPLPPSPSKYPHPPSSWTETKVEDDNNIYEYVGEPSMVLSGGEHVKPSQLSEEQKKFLKFKQKRPQKSRLPTPPPPPPPPGPPPSLTEWEQVEDMIARGEIPTTAPPPPPPPGPPPDLSSPADFRRKVREKMLADSKAFEDILKEEKREGRTLTKDEQAYLDEQNRLRRQLEKDMAEEQKRLDREKVGTYSVKKEVEKRDSESDDIESEIRDVLKKRQKGIYGDSDTDDDDEMITDVVGAPPYEFEWSRSQPIHPTPVSEYAERPDHDTLTGAFASAVNAALNKVSGLFNQ